MRHILFPLLLAACRPPILADSGDTADTGDTGDTADTADTADTGDTGDTADTADTGDTGDTAAPVADAGPDQMVTVGTEVTLDGSGSTASGGATLQYQWSFQAVPATSAVGDGSLHTPDVVNPTFTPDVVGDYVLSLAVYDGAAWSSPDTVTISAKGGA